MNQGPQQAQNMQEAMSLLALTNICFKQCVVRHKPVLVTPELRQDQLMTDKLSSLLTNRLEITNKDDWLLTEKETACLFNCSRSYAQLKEFLHEQMLKDFTHVRQTNRNVFESL